MIVWVLIGIAITIIAVISTLVWVYHCMFPDNQPDANQPNSDSNVDGNEIL